MIIYICVALGIVLAFSVAIAIFGVREKKKRKQESIENDRCVLENFDIQDDLPELNEIGAQIIDQRCGVDVRGTKSVYVNERFCITFLTDDGRTLEFFVPEEIYLALDKGQKGRLITTAKGTFYGFAVDEEA